MVALSFASCEQQETDPVEKDEFPEDAPTELVVDAETLELNYSLGKAIFNVTSNKKWTISADAAWVILNRTSAEPSKDPIEVRVSAVDNKEYVGRSAVITITAADKEHKVTVNQLPRVETEEEVLARMQTIPHIYIDVNGQEIKDKKTYIKGTVTILDLEKHYSDTKEQVLQMTKDGIRGRGNSTWGFAKKPYKLKFDSKVSILGFPEDKEWCLLANYADRTLLRNMTVMHISELCGMSWTPRMCSVEVTLDNKYLGVYNFCEHKKISKARVNIEVAEGQETEGGYYFEIDQRSVGEETYCWETGLKVPILVAEPEEPSAAQYAYVQQYFSDFEAALKAGDYSEETGYRKYIDVKSFIDYYIIQELSKNIDGNLRLSSFLTKEKGKKLEMYHVWDFDFALGNCGYFTTEMGISNGPEDFFIKDAKWYKYMFRDAKFVDEVQARWKELYPQLEAIPEWIDQEALYLEKARIRNFQTWDITKNDVSWVHMPNKGSYEAELQYLKSFYTSRLAWLNRELMKL